MADNNSGNVEFLKIQDVDLEVERRGAGPPVRLDEASSGRWFDGWKPRFRAAASHDPPEVPRPRTWLLRVGWRRHGLIGVEEVPGPEK